MTSAPGWDRRIPSRKERYRNALAAIRTVDMTTSGGIEATGSPLHKWRWICVALADEQFRRWFRIEGDVPVSGDTDITATGIAMAPSGGALHLRVGRGPVDVLDLATAVGHIGRILGWMNRPVSSAVYDSGTVTIATAALAVYSPGRAKEFWDLMAAVGLRGQTPPEAAGWSPQSWAGERP